MPDTPRTADELRAVRQATHCPEGRALLAHIDTLTAAVEGLEVYGHGYDDQEPPCVSALDFRDRVLAILRGGA